MRPLVGFSGVVGILLLGTAHSSATRVRVAAQAPRPEQPTEAGGQRDPTEYSRLVEQAKKRDSSVDFVTLRAAWGNDACNQVEAPNRDAMARAFNARDWTKAAELATAVLDHEFVNRDLHLATANAYKELGNSEKEMFHTAVAQMLLDAILRSGDGTTPQTAFRVYSLGEEYAVMRVLGYQVTMQAFVSGPSWSPFDLLTGENADKKTVSLYFDIYGALGGRASGPCVR